PVSSLRLKLASLPSVAQASWLRAFQRSTPSGPLRSSSSRASTKARWRWALLGLLALVLALGSGGGSSPHTSHHAAVISARSSLPPTGLLLLLTVISATRSVARPHWLAVSCSAATSDSAWSPR